MIPVDNEQQCFHLNWGHLEVCQIQRQRPTQVQNDSLSQRGVTY